jgi:hypothetical protein
MCSETENTIVKWSPGRGLVFSRRERIGWQRSRRGTATVAEAKIFAEGAEVYFSCFFYTLRS